MRRFNTWTLLGALLLAFGEYGVPRLLKLDNHPVHHAGRFKSLAEFQFWYNSVRPHQHLGGRTPAQAWHGIDPYRTVPKRARWFEAWEGRLRGWMLRH